jgi:hypothetical protein
MDYLELPELLLRIEMLPKISRVTPMGDLHAAFAGPSLYARQLIGVWGIPDRETTRLEQAFRFLPDGEVRGAIHFYLPDQTGHVKYWRFPTFKAILPTLHDASWRRIMAGELVLEGTRVGGKRRQEIPLPTLARLRPDWRMNRLRQDQRDVFYDVNVKQALKPADMEGEAHGRAGGVGHGRHRDGARA